MATASFSEHSVTIFQFTRCHMPDTWIYSFYITVIPCNLVGECSYVTENLLSLRGRVLTVALQVPSSCATIHPPARRVSLHRRPLRIFKAVFFPNVSFRFGLQLLCVTFFDVTFI